MISRLTVRHNIQQSSFHLGTKHQQFTEISVITETVKYILVTCRTSDGHTVTNTECNESVEEEMTVWYVSMRNNNGWNNSTT